MSSKLTKFISLAITLWIAKVFLLSLPYKFTKHPDTEHIFGTIGAWMSGNFSQGLGEFFSSYAAYLVGSVELIASALLLLASAIWILNAFNLLKPAFAHRHLYIAGGLLSSAVMSGAAFFHLFTPLGIEVIHQGASDEGSLFYAAVSILVLGLVLAFINKIQKTT